LAFAFIGGGEAGVSYSTAIYGAEGELLGASVSEEDFWRFPPGAEPPDKFVAALLAFEDRRFFSHPGFDASALVRALSSNLRAGKIVSGGSTLSMQAARLSLPAGERNLRRKALEMVLALRLEALLGKRGLLERYVSSAPFGGNVVGLEAASIRWFGLPPGGLSWAEAATLAVLPNDPARAHPGAGRAALQLKRDALLRRLRDRGLLTEDDLELALAEALPPEPFPLPRSAPRLLDRARAEATAGGAPLGSNAAHRDDLVATRRLAARGKAVDGAASRIMTTLDGRLQERVSAALARRSLALAGSGVRNAACLVARVGTGEVLAYVGNSPDSISGGHGSEVDMIRARRSTGSLLKPFLYAAMLDTGELSPRALVPDLPTRIGSYGPENNTRGYSGAVRADEALSRSLNVPFVRLLRTFGVERFRLLLRGMGLLGVDRGSDDYGLTLILGGAESTMWELAGAYAGLARAARGAGVPGGGLYYDSRRVMAAASPSAEGNPVRPGLFSAGAAALTLEALYGAARPEDEEAWKDFASSRKIAWKTGTSFGYRDAWAIGIASDYVVAVWFGNASGEGRPELKGSKAAAPLLFEVFGMLPREVEAPIASGALEARLHCAASGWPAGPDCARTETGYAPSGSAQGSACPYCRLVHLDPSGRYRSRAEAEPSGTLLTERRFVLPAAMEWYYRRGHIEYRPLPPWKPGLESRAGFTAPGGAGDFAFPLALIAPEQGASIYVPIELDGRPGRTIFSAAHRDPSERLFWHLDGDYLGATRGDHAVEARPAPGPHRVLVVDEEGNEASRGFSVLGRE